MINFHYAYDYVYDQILSELKEKGKDTVLCTEKEYCERFDVSLTTVRRALDRLYKENIIVKIKGKGSVVSEMVRAFKMTDNHFIGVLRIPFDDIQLDSISFGKYIYENPYEKKIYQTIYNELKNEYNILIDTIPADELEKKFSLSVLNQAEKIFVVGEASKKVIHYLHSLGKCVVVYNFFEKKVSVTRVNNDERLKYKEMTDYFIAQGHTKIACINGFNLLSETLERYMGFQDAMISNGLFVESKFIKWGDMTPESGYLLTKELMALPNKPTAIVCVNDGVAMGAYDALEELGVNIGKDVMLSGHDNCEMSDKKYLVSTIDPDYESVGRRIAEILKRDTWIDDETIIPGKIIIR